MTPYASVAVDKKYYPLGMPLILHKVSDKKLLPAISMDTGGAILEKIGPTFLPEGVMAAEKIAGELKKKLLIYVLVPKDYND